MVSDADVERIRSAAHDDPFAVLGMHADAKGSLWVRAFLPGAQRVQVLDAADERPLGELARRHDDGFFEARLRIRRARPYRLGVSWEPGPQTVLEAPSRFPPVLG